MKEDLLKIHQTEEITDLSKLGTIPADHVITMVGEDGEKTFYEIKMKEGQDSNKMVDTRGKDYKNVPREDMIRLREQMQMLEMLSDLETPGSAEMLAQATEDAKALLEQVNDGDAYKAAYDAIKRVDDYLAKGKVKAMFATWRPEGYGADIASFDTLKSSWEGSKKPADVEKLADAFHKKFEETHFPAAEHLKASHAKAVEKLDQIEQDLSSNKKGTEANVGAKIAQLTKMKPEDVLAGTSVNLSEMEEEEKQALETAVATIRGALAYLKDADKKFAGAQGEVRATLLELRQSLETRSQPTVDDVTTRANALSTKLQRSLETLDALISNKATDPQAFLLGIAKFLGDAQKGTMEARNDYEFSNEQKRLAEVERKKVQDWIKKNSLKTHRNYTEYKSIADALEGTFSAIETNLKASSDYKRSGQDYMDSAKNWLDLYNDVTNVEAIRTREWSFDFPAFERKLAASVGKVAAAAAKVKEMLGGKFSDDPRKDDTAAKGAVAAVNSVLDLCQQDKSGLLVLDTGVSVKLTNLNNPDHDLGKLDLKEKKAIISKIREDTLKQVRRIRSRLESDPAFEIYRNNPIDRGQTWVQLTATLLNMETTILKDLAP